MANFLTVAEYRASSTGQDSANLIPGGNQAAQDAELLRRIFNASAWMEDRATSPLIAASRVEMIRCRYQRDGTLSLHPRAAHLNQLTAASIGTNAADLATLSITGAFIDEQQWIIPQASGIWTSSSGSVQFGASTIGRLLAKLAHVTGWPNTTITSSPNNAGATTITVADPSGFTPFLGSVVADESVRIIDGALTETITVSAVNGSVLTISALANAHNAGTVVSMLPGDLKEAAIMATSAFLRARTSDAMVMAQTTQPGGPVNRDTQRWQLLADAARIIDNYGRVR